MMRRRNSTAQRPTVESDPALKARITGLIPWVFAGVAVLAFAGIGRPLWLDEVLHFALGDMSLAEVLRTIDYTTIEINHGQTGVYMFMDWLLLQVFGASAFALRIPSFIYGAVMLVAGISIMRNRSFGVIWQSLLVVGFFGSFFLMSYVGEARPYMPLAGSSVAMVAYFLYEPDKRRQLLPRLLATFGIIVGATMQAYWIFYLALAILAGLIAHAVDGHMYWSSWSRLRSYLALAFTIPGLLLFVVIGQLTWMRWPREFVYDPFQWFGTPQSALDVFIQDHITNGSLTALWVVLAIGALVSVALLRKRAVPLLAPAAVFAGGLMSSVVISWLSFSRGYWIVERQWVAGVALSIVGLVWFFALLWQISWRDKPYGWFTSGLFAGLLVISAFQSVNELLAQQRAWSSQQEVISGDTRDPQEIFQLPSEQAVVEAANVNVSRGGEVWPEFTIWYTQQAGMRDDFRGLHPNWTDWLEQNLGASFGRIGPASLE